MQNPLNQIVSSVFGESRLEDVPLDALHLLTVKYPFSAPVHLLYARRLKDSGDSRYGEAVSIAALHYANPHWLQHQLAAPLNTESFSVAAPDESTALLAEAEAENREMEALPPSSEEIGHDTAGRHADAVAGEKDDSHTDAIPPETDSITAVDSSDASAPASFPVEDVPEHIPGPTVHSDEMAEDSDNVSVALTEAAAPEPGPFEVAAGEETQEASETPYAPPSADTPSGDEDTVGDAEPSVHSDGGPEPGQAADATMPFPSETGITTLYEGETTEASREIGDSAFIHVTMPETGPGHTPDTQTVGDMPKESAVSAVSAVTAALTGEQGASHREAVEGPAVSGVTTGERPSDRISGPLTDDEPLPVEPLHLSDYLASQGIVVSSELEPREDAMGARSFTGWLRTMKRLQPDRSAPVLSEDEEDAIRSEAEASNQDEDIVTEAMAEVYARQGLIQKAIDIYEKLSLLDPDRTSTFADRISQLKALLT